MAHLHEVKICACYQSVLRRAPTMAELAYWIDYLRSGGTEDDIWLDLTGGYEFQLEAKTAFWAAFRRQPSDEEFARCRRLVSGGVALNEAVREIIAPAAAAQAS